MKRSEYWKLDVDDQVLPDASEQEDVGEVGDDQVVAQGKGNTFVVHLNVVYDGQEVADKVKQVWPHSLIQLALNFQTVHFSKGRTISYFLFA